MPFNLPGGPEVIVIILVALVVLGPEQLPKAMRSFGNAMGEIRKLSNGFQTEMRQAMQTMEEATSLPKGATSSTGSSAGAVETTGSEGSSTPSGPDPAVTEVVASNGAGSDADPDPAAPTPTTPSPAPPSISAADRAAG